MKFYFFSNGNHIVSNTVRELDKSGFTGVLFTYSIWAGDYLTQIARDMKDYENIIYMVAMRPYAVSPQYLNMISHGMQNIAKDRLQFNLVSGYLKRNEKNMGGILGEVNDNSTNIEKSNYLIDYMKELSRIEKENIYFKNSDFFVTSSNEYIFNSAKMLNQKVIIPYREYKKGYWTIYENYKEWGTETLERSQTSLGSKIDLKNTTAMISIAPILRKTKNELKEVIIRKKHDDQYYFTYEEFDNLIKKLEQEGIHYVMLQPWPSTEINYILDYVRNFKKIK